MAALECNGCLLTIDNRSFSYTVENPPGSGITDYYITGYPMIGVPQGQLSGITGLALCFVDVISSRPSRNGNCRAVTGIATYVGNPLVPANWSISTGSTGCSGVSGCSVSIDFYVDPNYALFNQISGSVLWVTLYNFYNGTYTGVTLSATTPISSGAFWTGFPLLSQDVTVNCGEKAQYLLEATWLLPAGASGRLYGAAGHTANCSYCSQYEMVALP